MGKGQNRNMNAKYQQIIKELKESSEKKEFFEIVKIFFQEHYDKCLLDVIQLDLLPPFYFSVLKSPGSEKILKEFIEYGNPIRKDEFIMVGSYYIYPITIDRNSQEYLLVFNDQINKYYDEIQALCIWVGNVFAMLMNNYQMGFEKSSVQNANLISQMSHDVNSMLSLIKSNSPEIQISVMDKMNYTIL